jgi:hypothetical protein
MLNVEMFLWGQHSSFVLFLPPTLHQLFTNSSPTLHQLFTNSSPHPSPTLRQLFANSSPGTSASNDHVLDLDGLVLAFVDVQSALQAAQAERDYYANECADRMVRREVQQCMMAGQPTGAVGALRWDVVKGRVRTTPVYFGLLWSPLVSFGLLWSPLVYFGLLWSTLVYFGLLY